MLFWRGGGCLVHLIGNVDKGNRVNVRDKGPYRARGRRQHALACLAGVFIPLLLNPLLVRLQCLTQRRHVAASPAPATCSPRNGEGSRGHSPHEGLARRPRGRCLPPQTPRAARRAPGHHTGRYKTDRLNESQWSWLAGSRFDHLF